MDTTKDILEAIIDKLNSLQGYCIDWSYDDMYEDVNGEVVKTEDIQDVINALKEARDL